MKRKDFLLKTLKNRKLNINEITDIYYETCSENVDSKRQSYIDKGKSMTEKQLRNQISAEFCSNMVDHYKNLFEIDKSMKPQSYSLTEKGIEKYNEIFVDEVEVTPTDEEIKEILSEDLSDGVGYVYLMKSKIHKNTYKIGITNRSIEERLFDLQRDRTYGSYNLAPLIHIKLKNYNQVEQVCHKFFEEY